MKQPSKCTDMADVRAEIDRLDAELVTLFAQRTAYIDRAAQIKAQINIPARIESRVEQVVENVRRHAEAQDLTPDLIEALWRQLIDWSIAREENDLDAHARNETDASAPPFDTRGQV